MASEWIYRPLVGIWIGIQGTSAMASGLPPSDRVKFDQARSSALKMYSGKIENSGIEERDGRWVYALEIRSSPRDRHEVLVDARTGEVIGSSVLKDDSTKR